MARNIQDNQSIFFQKLSQIVSEDVLRKSPGIKLVELSRDERNWLTKSKIYANNDARIGLDKYFVLLSYGGEYIFCSIGFDEFHENYADHVEQIEANAGIFMLIVNELGIKPLKAIDSVLNAENEVFLPVDDDKIYNISTFYQFYPKITFFKPLKNSSLINSGDDDVSHLKLSIFLLTCSKNVIELDFSEDFYNKLIEFCNLNNPLIPWGRIFRAITERRYENAFLEIYRCIEILYPLARIKELKKALETEKKHLDISSVIESTLGWRPQEEKALEDIFEKIEDDVKNKISLSHRDGGNPHKLFYKVRNNCVHLRPLQKTHGFLDGINWNLFMNGSLDIIFNIYANDFLNID